MEHLRKRRYGNLTNEIGIRISDPKEQLYTDVHLHQCSELEIPFGGQTWLAGEYRIR